MSKSSDATLGLASTGSDEPPDANGAPSLTRELARVEEANLGFYEAFSDRDLPAMSRVWSQSPHARCVHPGWDLVVGWTDIRQSWSEIFRSVHSIDFHLEDVHVEVSGRTAWVNLVAYVEIVTQDGDQFQASVVTTNIFEAVDGQWLLALHHSSNFVEDEDVEEEGDDLEFEPSSRGGTGTSEPN